jgi:hypothetical protein
MSTATSTALEQLERDIAGKRAELAELLTQRARLEARRQVYRCCVCRESYVDPYEGEDTCSACLGRA